MLYIFSPYLCLDYVKDQLFWVDAKQLTISVCNLKGPPSVRIVINDANFKLQKPFGIAVFEVRTYMKSCIEN